MPRPILTLSQLQQIREDYAAGGVSQDSLAVRFGVGQTTISRIIKGLGGHSRRSEALYSLTTPAVSADGMCTRCGGLRNSNHLLCSKCRSLGRRENNARECKKCGEIKLPSEFSRSKNTSVWCRQCCSRAAAEWRKKNPVKVKATEHKRRGRHKTPEQMEYHRRTRLAKKYGMTIEEYDSMLDRQNGCCAICGITPADMQWRWKRLHVDHDHETGKVRGLLCHNCNVGIGLLHDDPKLVLIALRYLSGESVIPSARIG